MNILSHRGYWKLPEEKNSLPAFKRSLELGFGIETDVRDYLGEIVISHDIPQGDDSLLIEFLEICKAYDYPLAINIKSDGLVNLLRKKIVEFGITNWFVFDMSIPDMRSYLDAKIPVFARMSEVEKDVPWLEEISGIWLDGFSGDWYGPQLILELLERGLHVCVVSPELHGRGPEKCWADMLPIADHPGLMLCTDSPEKAKAFFSEAK